MSELFNEELGVINLKLDSLNRNKEYQELYPREYAYFKQLLKPVTKQIPIEDISNIDLLTRNGIYSSNNISIILDLDFASKLTKHKITNEKFSEIMKEIIKHISQYSDIDKYNKAKFDLSYDLRNDIISNELLERKKTLEKIIANKEDKPKLLELFSGIGDTNKLFELFDFEPSYDLELISKPHAMYLFGLNHFLNKYKDAIIDDKQLLDLELWHKPVLNTPRDFILEATNESEISQYFITPELRLMSFLLTNGFIKHKFNRKYLDYILSVYRCCVFGNNKDIILFKNNSKYYDSGPYYGGGDCNKNDICDKYNLGWTLTNNAIGIELAARRRIIFPYMIISDSLETRYETIKFDLDSTMGIVILKISIGNGRYLYHYYYINIMTDIISNKIAIGFFDIYNNRIHFKSSPSAQPRGQLLESKWAIYKLLWYLSFRKIIPYTQKTECDIILYKTNKKISIQGREDKDMYLLSIYNKDEIRQMYNNILRSIQTFRKNPQYKSLETLIGLFISELESYTIINKYRLFHVESCNKLFVWEIAPSERLHWSEWKDITKCIKLYTDKLPDKLSEDLSTISCIKSNLYISMDDKLEGHNKLAFNKSELSFNIGDILPDILEYPYENYTPIKYYYKAIDYNNNQKYKDAVDLYKKNLNRLYIRIYYEFLRYSFRDDDAPLAYDKEKQSLVDSFDIIEQKDIKHYYKALDYYNNNKYKDAVNLYKEKTNTKFKLDEAPKESISPRVFIQLKGFIPSKSQQDTKGIESSGNSLGTPRVTRPKPGYYYKYLKYKQKYLKLKLYINNV
jgi:hypothetical protein